MSIAVGAAIMLLIGLALAYVLQPLLQPEQFAADERRLSPAEQLARARGTIARAIRDLDLDFGTGKLSEADYRQQRDRLERRALELRRAEDAEEALLSAEIEREIAALRSSSPPRHEERAEDLVEGSPQPSPGGRGQESGVRPERRPQPSRCPWCHQPLREDDDICPRCGQSVREALV